MVVVKTLTYRQFSFLLSMASARTGSVGSSSDVGSTGSQTPLSSEMSEVRVRGARHYTPQPCRPCWGLVVACLGTY